MATRNVHFCLARAQKARNSCATGPHIKVDLTHDSVCPKWKLAAYTSTGGHALRMRLYGCRRVSERSWTVWRNDARLNAWHWPLLHLALLSKRAGWAVPRCPAPYSCLRIAWYCGFSKQMIRAIKQDQSCFPMFSYGVIV